MEKVRAKIEVKEVDIKKIQTNPNQPRKIFDEAKLEELAISMGAIGLQVPIQIKPGIDGKFELIAGERRLKAAKKLGWKKILANIFHEKVNTFTRSLVENVARENLNPIEEALAFKRLIEEKRTQAQIAQLNGKSAGYVSSRLTLLLLPPEIQELISAGKLPPVTARHLKQFKGEKSGLIKLANEIISERLTADQARQKIRDIEIRKREANSGVKRYTEDEIIELSISKNLEFFLEKVCSYILHISGKEKVDQKILLSKLTKNQRDLVKLALQKIVKHAQTIITAIQELNRD